MLDGLRFPSPPLNTQDHHLSRSFETSRMKNYGSCKHYARVARSMEFIID